jgi:hypothetical protein
MFYPSEPETQTYTKKEETKEKGPYKPKPKQIFKGLKNKKGSKDSAQKSPRK